MPRSDNPEFPPSRLLRCRTYRHGLSQAPPLRDPPLRGVDALLPCPRDDQGVCPYRRAYGCTEKMQRASRDVLGHCGIERLQYEDAQRRGHTLVSYLPPERLSAEAKRLVELWAEAVVYRMRACAAALMRMAGEIQVPSLKDCLRYQTAAMNAASARLDAICRWEEPGAPVEWKPGEDRSKAD